MTISIRRISLGTGYRYLMDSVARGDGAADHSSPLTRYYAETGTPPGRLLGAGLAGLNGGSGVVAASEVTEQMLFNMLGLCADPITGEPLGRSCKRWPKPLTERIDERVAALPVPLTDEERAAGIAVIEAKAQERRLSYPVAGFDLTFSVPKSISVAWALADAPTQAIIYQAHQEAIQHTIGYAERHAFFTRSGTNGVVQEPIRGVVAVGFDHWDSRAGDPQLHTHVVVLNRAQSLDGTWRTLDSRGLFKQVVTLSELHEGILDDLLTARLSWGFDPRPRRHSDEPKYEVTGVSDALIGEFSQRSGQIEANKETLVARFVAEHGRQPTTVEVTRLRQRATLATRPDKQKHSLAEQTIAWRHRAEQVVGDDPAGWARSLRERNELPLLHAGDLDDGMLGQLAHLVTEKVAERRATFTRANLLAEMHRQLHGVRFATPDDRIATAEHATDLAVAGALLLTPPELHHVPAAFRRADGTSKFRGIGAEVYTTRALLDAEARLLDAGRTSTAPAVERSALGAVAAAELPGSNRVMSTDQALAVETIATSGRVLDLLVGPAGTGKSTTLAGLRAAWETQHGPQSVIGLAPSAAAADVLADELGISTDNIAKWLTEHRRQPERRAALKRLRAAHHHPHADPARRAQLARGIAAAQAEHDRWTIHAGHLVIVDEASLAGTLALDALTRHARAAGAKLVLAGDWAQLSAVDAGGAFALLVRDRSTVAELVDVRRFRHPWERRASLALRRGDEKVIDTYHRHGRISSGPREELLDTLYTAWKTDTDAGKTSLMIAADRDTVAALNARARADRITAGHVTAHGVPVASDGTAGIGDRVVTRQNNRQLTDGRNSWVKNGDAWWVTAVNSDGSLVVRRSSSRSTLVLPADYVAEHVELGYASTAHRAQGRTVDTAHAMITVTTTREVLYVSATRGRESNRLYVDTHHDPDHDTAHGPIQPRTPAAVLTGALADVGADQAAHSLLARELDTAGSIPTLAAEYLTIAAAAEADRWNRLLDTSGLAPEQAAQVRESPAYGALVAAFREADARGLDITATLPRLVQARERGSARDIASVLHERVSRWITAAASGEPTAGSRFIVGLIPEVRQVADPDTAHALTERAHAMQRRAKALADQAVAANAPWIRRLGPPPVDPARHAAWLREASTVAAFRDRWNVIGDDLFRLGRSSVEQLSHQKRAEQAATRARRIAQATDDPRNEAAPTTVVEPNYLSL